MKKRFFVSVGIVGVVFLIVLGIRWRQYQRFNPKLYTQMYLDAAYKNEYSEEQSVSYFSVDDAEKIYKENLAAIEESFKTASLSETLEKEYKGLFEMIMKSVNYQVMQAKKEKNNEYIVTVQAKPLMIFDDTFEEFQKKSKSYSTEVANAVMKGEEMPSESNMKETIYQLYYEVLQQGLESKLNYGNTQTVELHIKKADSGAYNIEKEDIRHLEKVLISQEKLEDN